MFIARAQRNAALRQECLVSLPDIKQHITPDGVSCPESSNL